MLGFSQSWLLTTVNVRTGQTMVMVKGLIAVAIPHLNVFRQLVGIKLGYLFICFSSCLITEGWLQ